MKLFSTIKVGLVALAGILASQAASRAEILYFHNFGTTTISGNTYTVAPTTLNSNLTSGGWSTSAASFVNYTGASGNALSLGNSGGTPTYTLTLTVAPGYSMSIDSLSFWRQNSGSGAKNITVTVNSLSVGTTPTDPIPSASPGANTGTVALSNNNTNLTGTVTIVLRLSGATGTGTFRLDDFTINGTVVLAGPTNNDTTITASTSTVALGRVMQGSANTANNVTLNKVGANTTTYTASPTGNAVVADNGNSFAAGSQSDQITVGIDRSTTGAKTGTVVIDNAATTTNGANQGSADPNDTINVSGTVVANRAINASSVDLGKVFTDAAVSGTTTLTTTGDDSHFTRVTVNGTQITNGNIAATAGTNALFNDAADTATRVVSGNFTSSGVQNGSVNLSVTGEGLVGETVGPVAVNVTANVFERASLSTNNGSALGSGDSATIFNDFAAGTQRADAKVASKTVTGSGWSVTGANVGADLVAGGDEVVGTASFDETGKLNGNHVGSLVIGFQYADSSIKGAGAATELAPRTWNLNHTVSGRTASSGDATVLAGGSYEGFSLQNNSGRATDVALLAGTATATTTVSMSFSTIDPGATGDALRVSDIVNLEGTDGDLIVLQLTYDEADLGALQEGDLRLAWFNGSDWVEATLGNHGAGTGGFVGITPYDSGFFVLGNYGIDTANNTVWAVVNHNSEFAVVGSPIPEPGSIALLAAAGGYILISRRRRRA